MSVLIVTWKKSLFTSRRAFILSIIILVTITLVNLHVIFTFGQQEEDQSLNKINGTTNKKVICNYLPLIESTKIMSIWSTVRKYFYFFSTYPI